MQESADKIVAAGGRATIDVGDVRDPTSCSASWMSAWRSTVASTSSSTTPATAFSVRSSTATSTRGARCWRPTCSRCSLAARRPCGQCARRVIPGTSSIRHPIAALSPDSGVYGATKHAVNVITNTLRAELDNDPDPDLLGDAGSGRDQLGRENPEIVAGVVAMSGIEHDVKKGERLPDAILEAPRPSWVTSSSSPTTSPTP